MNYKVKCMKLIAWEKVCPEENVCSYLSLNIYNIYIHIMHI